MSWLKNLFKGTGEAGCHSCHSKEVGFRCTRCQKTFCETCITEFGVKAARILAERVYGKGTYVGTAKIFDGQGRAFCPDCYGSLLDRAQRTGQWVVNSPEEMDPSCVRI